MFKIDSVSVNTPLISPIHHAVWHENADARLLLHAYPVFIFFKLPPIVISKSLYQDCGLRLLWLHACSKFQLIGSEELWVSLGANKNLRIFAIHKIVTTRPSKADTLTIFHAFSGYIQPQLLISEVTEAFTSCLTCEEPSDPNIQLIHWENYCSDVLLYDRTSAIIN